MAALTKDRSTTYRSGDKRSVPVKAATKIYAGAMAAVDANGWGLPAAAVVAHRVLGRNESYVDNSAGANGDVRAEIGAGIYRYGNSAAGDLIARKDIGAACYVVDDQTVALTDATGTRPKAGTIFDVDDEGVWVRFGLGV